MTGRTLADRYELAQSIGHGGMGQVWSALDTRLRRQVAVKTVDLGPDDVVAGERFRQEAQATAALSHPNIVTIFDSGLDGATAFLVMELLRGPALDELVRERGPLPVDLALDYAGQVASALGAAHAAGIVHRDVKPSNLMLDGRGTLKVVDFGIARLDQERANRLTATATVVGSAPYLSPEQATGGTATPQSDLYSLGCVLMTLLTGAPPFAGEHPLSVLHQHLSDTPPAPSSRRPQVPQQVDALVAQLLAKSPADRPASAADVAAQIATIRRGGATATLPVAGTVAAAPTTVLPPVSEPVTRPQPVVTPVRREEPVVTRVERRRGGGALGPLLASLLVLALLAGLGWWMLQNRSGGGSPAPSPTVVTSTTVVAPTTTDPESTVSTPEPDPTTSEAAPSATPTTPAATPTATPSTVTATVTVTPHPTTDVPVPTETTAPEQPTSAPDPATPPTTAPTPVIPTGGPTTALAP